MRASLTFQVDSSLVFNFFKIFQRSESADLRADLFRGALAKIAINFGSGSQGLFHRNFHSKR